MYSQSSFTKPNDVYIIRGLDQLPASYDSWDHDTKGLNAQTFAVTQLTKFTEEELKGKVLDPGEDFYFDGAERKIQGWILKPKGYREGDKKKWPPLLFIHGGPQGAWEDGWSTRWNPNGMARLDCRGGRSQEADLRVLQCLLIRDISSLPSILLVQPHSGRVLVPWSFPPSITAD